jgi:trans-aconitate methyltransferase
MIPKPKHLQPPYGAQFKDESVVSAYQYRPEYPVELFEVVSDLISDEPRRVLDVGCGTGYVARYLVNYVEAVEAVDFSHHMIETGKMLPNGDHPNLTWIESAIEKAPLAPPYALITAGQSLHWMDWYVVLPRFAEILTANGRLAILGLTYTPPPWQPALFALINRYSTNQDYQPYDLIDELEKRHLFTVHGQQATEPFNFVQPIEQYIESWHARNGLSRDKMGEQAAVFDQEAREIIVSHCQNGRIESEIVGHVTWGKPHNLK